MLFRNSALSIIKLASQRGIGKLIPIIGAESTAASKVTLSRSKYPLRIEHPIECANA